MNISNAFSDIHFSRAILTLIFLCLGCAPIGIFLIMRRLSLVADSIGHTILPGAAIGSMLGNGSSIATTIGAAVTGISLFAMISKIPKNTKIPEDTLIALFYLGSLSLGIVIISDNHEQLEALLFGSISQIDNFTFIFCAIISIISIIVMSKIYEPLLLDSIDPEYMEGDTRIKNAKTLFFIMFALMCVAAFKAIGSLLAMGIIIAPAAISRFWVDNLKKQIILSILIGIVCSTLGFVIATVFALNTSAVITILLVASLLISLLIRVNK